MATPKELFEPVSDAFNGMNLLTHAALTCWLWFVAHTGCIASILAVFVLGFNLVAAALKARREWMQRPNKRKDGEK